ncbi:magnesium chelatase subunit H [Aquibium sp. A9E412]|uniref:magnesium chelatase subunit H n=1 Tax=Aquibium sp. A9E412 TaxID=2976767 RepID=UPI0025B04646|nr:magnesium chelatase subunit H [Aquibium sp. A9E412]MDN2566063.1 magnesium chelatase subunit H [Aquibium sp. A9E412]
MTQKRISAAERGAGAAPADPAVKVTIVTLDSHMASAVARARAVLRGELPGLELTLHAVTEWGGDEAAAERCRKDIESADIVVANMIFLEEHVRRVGPWLAARREACDAMVGCLAAAEIVRLTRIGDFSMAQPSGGAIGLLKRLRGQHRSGASAGRGQMKLLRSIPRLLKYIPGKAQDVRAYFLTLQYLLAGSDDNIVNLVRFLVSRYAAGPRAALRRTVRAADPVHYPDVGLYHPDLAARVADHPEALARLRGKARAGTSGTVGLIVMRSYVLADNTAHYDGVIRALEARGLAVVPAFASGLDARPAIERFFMKDGRATVDAVVSLTGFSLVGGPAFNDAAAAEAMLARLDVPYLSAFATEFQSLPEWQAGEQGLTPVETTIMVALPEIDGATGPMLYGGRRGGEGGRAARDMGCDAERAAMLAARVDKLVRLRRKPAAERKVAAVIYNFPPNGGATGTAAHLDVFASLFNTLAALQADGYTVALPADAEALRAAVLGGNAERHGMPANVAAFVDADTHVRRETFLPEIEAQWGPAPGRHQSDGARLFVLGRHFGNVFVGVQPAFGYEGDPMRLLFEKSFAPTHAFAAFYRHLREDFAADVVLHFGTHGALEFMPGKQVGLSGACWPDRLIGDLPNVYLYAANNPSEGTIARRRSAATLVSHLTPPVGHAGLYKGLIDLKSALDRWRALPPAAQDERVRLAEAIRTQAAALDLVAEDAAWSADGAAEVSALAERVREFETTLIPHGLHVVGRPPAPEARADLLAAVNEAMGEDRLDDAAVAAIAAGRAPATQDRAAAETGRRLARLAADLSVDHELPALIHALGGGYVRPVSGGDLVRSPDIVPTGRNLHGFDPFRLPSAFAVADGQRQAERLLERLARDTGAVPKRLAMVLWGTDNLKSEGAPIAQVLALIGATPRFDGFGRLAGADLIPLAALGRPRVDVVVTLSGIFRDLLPLQTRLLAEASLEAARADEPLDQNPVRAHALAYAEAHGCPLETAALRVFSNAAGAYGSNVNMLIDSGAWDDEDEIADTYTRRKCFAYAVDGRPVKQPELLGAILKDVEAAYQNIESLELGITSIDHYFDTLGGISRAVRRAGGREPAVYVGDQTCGTGKVRTLSEQVALETRTRMLNPKWYEGLLAHGYEGVRQIESHVTNTLGWSATTGQVAPWVYRHLAETFVLDETMRRRMAALNPRASAKLANRLIEASERRYWTPDDDTWNALRAAGDELEDRVEGITVEAAA